MDPQYDLVPVDHDPFADLPAPNGVPRITIAPPATFDQRFNAMPVDGGEPVQPGKKVWSPTLGPGGGILTQLNPISSANAADSGSPYTPLAGPNGVGGNFGTMMPQEAAIARTPGTALEGMAEHTLQIPQRVFESVDQYQKTGQYDPAPVIEAVTTLGGIGATRAMIGSATGELGAFGGVTRLQDVDAKPFAVHTNPSPTTAAMLVKNAKNGFARYFVDPENNLHMWSGDAAFLHTDLMDHLGTDYTWQNYGGAGEVKNADDAMTMAKQFAGNKQGAYPVNPAAPPKPAAPFPQYAEQYPDIGPPVTAIDKKTGESYLAKKLTPEAEAFSAKRDQIREDMEKNGFTPYYDPSQRFHVDPSQHPPGFDTATAVPAKQQTIDKHLETIGAEETRQRLRQAYSKGLEVAGDPQHWYAMGQLESDFIKELGPQEGRRAFRERFATSMAATTGGADPTANLLMSQYGNYLRAKGLPYPQASYEMPYPIGGRYVTGNMAQHERIFNEGGYSALGERNPKRADFAQSYLGSPKSFTWDEQMTSGATPGRSIPPGDTYGLHERVGREEAERAGAERPQNYQDVAWAGFKAMKDPSYVAKPMIAHVNEAIERTHRLTGLPRSEIVRRGLIRGEIPIYGTAGLAAALSKAMQQEDAR